MSRRKSAAALCAVALLLVAAFPAATGAADLSKAPESFRARFIETRTLPGFDQPLVSRGNVTFSRTRGVVWEVTAPYHYVFRLSASGAEEQMPDGSVRHLDAEHAPWLAVVRHIFSGALAGNISELRRYFHVRVTALRAGRRIELTPKSGPMAKAINRIRVTEAGTPRSLRIDEASGGRIVIRFLEAKTAAEMP